MISRHLIVKFYLWILLAMTVSVAAAGTVVSLLSYQRWEDRLSGWVLDEARIGRDIAANLLNSGMGREQLQQALAPLMKEQRLSLTIQDGGRRTLLALPPREEGATPVIPPALAARALAEDGVLQWRHDPLDRVRAILPLPLEPGEQGWLVVTVQKGSLAVRRGPPFHLLTGLGVILLVVWGLSWPLAAHLARPLRRLTDTAEALGRGNLSARADIKRNDEIGRLAKGFNAMADNVQRLIMAQKQLLADMSHEIRSPLSRLKVALELGRRSAGEAGAEALDTAERQADAIESLAAELLTYSRLDIGPYELVREAVAPGSLVEDALAPLLPEIESGRIKVETRLEGLPTSFSADRRLMERALGNVLRNAIEHAPEGSVLYIGGKEAEGRLMVTVTDQGRGVPPEHLERIFLPFTRVDSGRPRAGGGVGLGLAIARRCLEAHGGGALAGAGADGRGLTVTLWLPAAEATEPPPR